MKALQWASLSLSVFAIAGCGTHSNLYQAAENNIGIDGEVCASQAQEIPRGLVKSDNPDLLKQSLGKSDAGKLCSGQVYKATGEVTVYRLSNSEELYTINGNWWALTPPTGSKEAYQRDNDICPEWSPLDRMRNCTLKVGSEVVIGSGQSVQCENTHMPKSSSLQMYIPNDSRNGVLWVENCNDLPPWVN
jgi:hypothetical protein